jgi:dihydrofolate reductase
MGASTVRRVIPKMSISLDGFMEGPAGEIDWHLVDGELHRHVNPFIAGTGGFLEGRRTYELMEQYWPTADRDPAAPEPVREFARIWREMPKVVYSRTLASAGRNATIVREVPPRRSCASRPSRVGTCSSAAPTWRPHSCATT